MRQETRQRLTNIYEDAIATNWSPIEIVGHYGKKPNGKFSKFIAYAREGHSLNECLSLYKKECRLQQSKHAGKKGLARYCDESLKRELENRGWTVTCKRTKTITQTIEETL